jgi:transcription initiation factor IIE alpha subunit
MSENTIHSDDLPNLTKEFPYLSEDIIKGDDNMTINTYMRLLRTLKTCSCGKQYMMAQQGTTDKHGNFYFNCENCKSTLVELDPTYQAIQQASRRARIWVNKALKELSFKILD